MIAGMAPFIINFFMLPVYTRFMTPEDYGILALLNSLASFYSLLHRSPAVHEYRPILLRLRRRGETAILLYDLIWRHRIGPGSACASSFCR